MNIRRKKSVVERFAARHARSALRASTRKFIEACETLAEAREVLPHGAWIKFCADLGLSRREAARMAAVGRHERLTDRSIAGKLPWDPKVICELARLKLATFDKLFDAGRIGPSLNRAVAGRYARMSDFGLQMVCRREAE